MAQAYCPVCCTAHSQAVDCPGDLRATGPERHAWRIEVDTPRGKQSMGVLVAPSYDLWRARILTYPNVLWAIPGGAATLKFVGRTAPEAEAKAVAFVEAHCFEKGYLRRDGLVPAEAGRFDADETPSGRRPKSPLPAKRRLRALPVRFGERRADRQGISVNLSEDGMCIATSAPLEAGSSLRIVMPLQRETIEVEAIVIWARTRPEPGRPLGMGVRLSAAPAAYLRFVRDLP